MIKITQDECEIDIGKIENWLKVGYVEAAFESVKNGLLCQKEKDLQFAVTCDRLVNIYSSVAEHHSDKRDWLLAGQVLFDAGRIEILCGRLDKAYRYFLDSGESYANSPRLFRYAASAYITGIAIANRFLSESQLSNYVERVLWWIDWEAERYRLSRDNELLAQTLDEKAFFQFLLGRHRDAIENLEEAAKLYEKVGSPIYDTMAAFRYSLISNIQRSITEELGWSKYNRLAYQAFSKAGDLVAASIEALKLNLYVSTDKASISNILDVAQKISATTSRNAAFSLLLTVFIASLNVELNEVIDNLHKSILGYTEDSLDIKLSEFIRLLLASKYGYSVEIDHLGRYKLVGDRWIRI